MVTQISILDSAATDNDIPVATTSDGNSAQNKYNVSITCGTTITAPSSRVYVFILVTSSVSLFVVIVDGLSKVTDRWIDR